MVLLIGNPAGAEMEFRSLDISVDGGSLEAYEVSSKAIQLYNWLDNDVHGQHKEIVASVIRQHCKSVAIGRALYVEEEYRGQGIGSYLVSELINITCADVVLLIADAAEIRSDGSTLKSWYEEWGFAEVFATSSGPLMAYPEDMARILTLDIEKRMTAANPSIQSERPG